MAKEEPPSTSKDLQELQRKLSLLIASVQSNSKAPDLEEVKKKLDFFKDCGFLYEVSSGSVPGPASFPDPHLAGICCFVSRSCRFLPAPRGAYLPGCFCGSHITGRTGHLCGRPRTALCPLWLGLCVTRHVRDNHGVLHGNLQPHQLLVFSQAVAATQLQW